MIQRCVSQVTKKLEGAEEKDTGFLKELLLKLRLPSDSQLLEAESKALVEIVYIAKRDQVAGHVIWQVYKKWYKAHYKVTRARVTLQMFTKELKRILHVVDEDSYVSKIIPVFDLDAPQLVLSTEDVERLNAINSTS